MRARLGPGARLEWLPLETIAFSGCQARNQVSFELAAGAEMIGWDVLALGLPAADAAFSRGCFEQSIELPGRWLERGVIDANDRRLLESPVGLAGRPVLATMWFGCGTTIGAARRDVLLDAAREAAGRSALAAGASSPSETLVVLRALGMRVEPVFALLIEIWSRWAPGWPGMWRRFYRACGALDALRRCGNRRCTRGCNTLRSVPIAK